MARPSRKKERTPFGSKKLKLAPKGKLPKNRYHHWFNDTGDNISAAIEAGYSFINAEHVPLEDGEDDSLSKARLRKQVGTNEKGEPIYAYMMSKPKDWYEEDYAKKQAEIDERERELTKGQGTKLAEQAGENTYVDPGNRITTERIRNMPQD